MSAPLFLRTSALTHLTRLSFCVSVCLSASLASFTGTLTGTLTGALAQALEGDPPALDVNPKPPSKPAIERVGEHGLRVAGMLINRQTKELEIPARVNLRRGILEYYAVSSNGKLHEAVLEVEAEPSHVHLALLLAGYEPSVYGPEDPKTYERPLKRRGSLLRLYVKWTPEGLARPQWLPASVWLFDRSLNSAPPPALYVFKGSAFERNLYMGDIERSVVGLIQDASVVIGLAQERGNPYHGEALGFEVHTSVIPNKGTPVTLVVRPASYQDNLNYEATLKELKAQRAEELKRQAEAEARGPAPRPSFMVTAPPHPSSALSYPEAP